jgi:hypothetical protein
MTSRAKTASVMNHMGPTLADNVIQGAAGPDEFRTAPLWGIGQRVFFLHDGRTNDLLQAIQLHASGAVTGLLACGSREGCVRRRVQVFFACGARVFSQAGRRSFRPWESRTLRNWNAGVFGGGNAGRGV